MNPFTACSLIKRMPKHSITCFLSATFLLFFTVLSVFAEPMRIRGTLPWHNFLSGPTAWDDNDYEKYFDQMKDLGLNYVTFHCYTGGAERYAPYVEPLIRMEFRNVVPEAMLDTSLTARWGYRPLPISEFAFGTSKLFSNNQGVDAFGARCATTARNNVERYQLAQKQMQRVIEMAHRRGIQVGLGFEFGIHPLEFWSIVPPGAYIRGAGIPDPTHPASIEILHNTLDNLFQNYPNLDWIWLWLHEHTMYVGQPEFSPQLKALMEQHRALFKESGGDPITFTGVWSLAYIQAAYDYIKRKSPKTGIAISGWGGGNQLTGVLLGLNKILPKDIVFSCLNPGMGISPQASFMAEIAKERPVWAIPWLEGDSSLWHLQPRAADMLQQVKLAQSQKLDGVLAIHWRTEETQMNLDAFANAAREPEKTLSAEEFYQRYCIRQYGQRAASVIAPILIRHDKTQCWQIASPEYFPYDPSWGRLDSQRRAQYTKDLDSVRSAIDLTDDSFQKSNIQWLAAEYEFTLLLDEVGRKIEPAYRLKQELFLAATPLD